MPESTHQIASFVVRYWRLPDGEGRVAIEHVQTGERVRAESLAGALAWIEARLGQGSPPGAVLAPVPPAADGK